MVVIHITTGRVLQFPEARSCFLHFSFVQCLDLRIEAKPLFQRKSLRDFNSTTATQAPPWKALQGTSAAGGPFSQVSLLLSLPPQVDLKVALTMNWCIFSIIAEHIKTTALIFQKYSHNPNRDKTMCFPAEKLFLNLPKLVRIFALRLLWQHNKGRSQKIKMEI